MNRRLMKNWTGLRESMDKAVLVSLSNHLTDPLVHFNRLQPQQSYLNGNHDLYAGSAGKLFLPSLSFSSMEQLKKLGVV